MATPLAPYLDPWTLPSIPLTEWHQLPAVPGLSFVIRKQALLHVGCSNSLQHQWSPHPLQARFQSFCSDTYIHIASQPTTNLHMLLRQAATFIDEFNPQYNAVKETLAAVKILQALEFINDELQELEAQPYLLDCYVQRTAAGGTAAGKGRDPGRYACLRSRKQTFSGGKKSKYIPLSAIAHYEAQCQRGRRIKKLRTSQQRSQQQLEKLRPILRKTGIELPK